MSAGTITSWPSCAASLNIAAVKVYRSRVFTPVRDPFPAGVDDSYRWFDDGHLAVDDAGRIVSVGEWSDAPEGEVVDLTGKIITPGLIDTHLHAPQIEMIGSYGGHLLEWLNRYTFPTERKFEDPEHARRVARAFYDVLLRHGTLTALIFSTVHSTATE